MKTVTTRFAPSPTGYLHIGGLRTALFNYLWAKKNKGYFRLRIEDTDKTRYVPGAEQQLIEVLGKLGLKPNGDIVFQSERAQRGIYKQIAEELVRSRNAYYCFCSVQRLEQLRKQQTIQKQPPGYDGRCRALAADDVRQRIENGEKPTIRLKWDVPSNQTVSFRDALHGTVTFSKKTLEDVILLKSDGYPTYHLASVVDDHDMGITHVIRGEEWLPSAPLHDILYIYLNYPRPEFWHLPLILNPDRSKLSKRQGDVSVESYLAKGYLPHAIINYIAFLGWNPGGDREIFSLDELTSVFDLKQLNKSAAIFSIQKLNWYNAEYIRHDLASTSDRELYLTLKPFLPRFENKQALQIFNLFFERISNLSELAEVSQFLLTLPSYPASLLIFKKSSPDATRRGVQEALICLEEYDGEWTSVNLDLQLKKVTNTHNLTPGDVYWPVRVALSGLAASPPPTDLLNFLGKKESVKRLRRALEKLKQHP